MIDVYQNQIKLYQKALKTHGISPKALKWHNYKSISTRYEILLKYIDINNKSILEIGSGFGDLIPFLQEKSDNFTYLGLDLVPEFINIARINHPDYKFKLHNILKKPLKSKFDIVITSGAFNANVKNNKKYRREVISTLWNQTNSVLAFNLVGGHPQPKNKKTNIVYYSDSVEIYKYCLSLSKKIIIDQSYLPKDFTIIMTK